MSYFDEKILSGISRKVYAKTREECEEKLAELIKTMKAEIKEGKAKQKEGAE